VLADMRTRTDQRVAELGGPLADAKSNFSPSTPPHPEASGLISHRANNEGFVRLSPAKNNLRPWSGDPK